MLGDGRGILEPQPAEELSFILPLRPDLRKQWEESGYLRGYGSSAILPPPSSGFRRLYYLTGPDYAVSDIVFGRLKVARILRA